MEQILIAHTRYPFWAADNEALRPLYGKPHAVGIAFDKENMPRTSVWLMRTANWHPNPADDRLDALMGLDFANRPSIKAELYERAGATFFSHWHQSETMRYTHTPTITTKIAFKKMDSTAENLRLAEEELDMNTLGLEEAFIVEERKTLQWLKEGAPLEHYVADEIMAWDSGKLFLGDVGSVPHL